jgi:hypothetical protein
MGQYERLVYSYEYRSAKKGGGTWSYNKLVNLEQLINLIRCP